MPRVCLAVTGSIACVKLPALVEGLLGLGCEVDVVLTAAAQKLLHNAVYKGVKVGEADVLRRPGVAVHTDADEWDAYTTVGVDPVLHIDIAKRCDVLLVAPLSANTLAEVALGLCPNLLTSVVRAWPYGLRPCAGHAEKPFLAAPAMNTVMWDQGITGEHIATLEARGVRLVDPVVKTLACGDVGKGAMAEVATILAAVAAALPCPSPATAPETGVDTQPPSGPAAPSLGSSQ
eukprot:TRINITY_DN2078_c6_g1_i2.p2 TRINITY_DN2078_c6_g1~~TRINITY_DN2078_c6_g1_i2.p2  ORF type:complete len:233 (+),score=78.04 TRINITY_DN2078_c6_g1_i2:97-795(+)